MKQAKISEIFLSYQGEGPFIGSRQLFVRFYGCNLGCAYCDTPLESFKSFSKEDLLGKILDFEDDFNELTLTGGEPLLHGDFLKDFLPIFKKHRGHRIYLETNGTLPDELDKLIGNIDIVSMDFKLPSSVDSAEDFWGEHEKFIKKAVQRELIVKAVVTDSTGIDDIKSMCRIIKPLEGEMMLVLQPVTPVSGRIKGPDEEMISFFKRYVMQATGKEVRILPQVHKILEVR